MSQLRRGVGLWTRHCFEQARRCYTPSAAEIQRLRYRTDAGLMDCKKALASSNGDFDAAVLWLQKNGAAKAVKNSDRVTDHGVLIAAVAPKAAGAAILQLCSETDFASRNERFLHFADSVRLKCIDLFSTTTHGLMDYGLTNAEVDARRSDFLQKLKAQIEVRRAEAISGLGENLLLKEVFTLPTLDADQAAGVIKSDLSDLFGVYVHNSIPPFAHVGSTACIVQLQPRDAEAAVRTCPQVLEAGDLAQHCVANLGDESVLNQQSFLGTDETTGQWLKRHGVKLQRGIALKFGEQPKYFTMPKPAPQKEARN